MGKPRVIIADEDYSYIIPLQLKFAEEFYDHIDLEIITQLEYLQEFLSTPQKAAILIISETMYSKQVQRHNFSNVFVMVEDLEDQDTSEPGVTRLLKYTSLKEIFNRITGKSADMLSGGEHRKKETQIVVVCSAHGGAGKTTIATGISACLAQSYKKVLYLNADRLQNFHLFLQNKEPITSGEVYSRLMGAAQNMFQDVQHIIRKESFYYLPPFKAALMSLGIQYKVFAILADSAKRTNQFDFVIIDTNTGFDENFAMLLKIADKVIIATENTRASVYATNNFVSNINGIGNEKYLFICNKFHAETEKNDPVLQKKYKINEYVHCFDNYDNLEIADFAKDRGLQRTAFLLI